MVVGSRAVHLLVGDAGRRWQCRGAGREVWRPSLCFESAGGSSDRDYAINCISFHSLELSTGGDSIDKGRSCWDTDQDVLKTC
jgi:hypothetical protein